MSTLSTEDGGDLLVALLLCDAEGCCARWEPVPFMCSLHVPLPLRREVHCFCRPLRAAFMKAVLPSLSACLPPSPQAAPHKSHDPSLPHAWGHSNPSYPAYPLVLHKQPHRLCVSADDLLPAGCQCCTAVFWGPSLRVARSVWPPGRGSRLSAGGSPRFGRGVSGNSSGSPSALLWLSECRAALLL